MFYFIISCFAELFFFFASAMFSLHMHLQLSTAITLCITLVTFGDLLIRFSICRTAINHIEYILNNPFDFLFCLVYILHISKQHLFS